MSASKALTLGFLTCTLTLLFLLVTPVSIQTAQSHDASLSDGSVWTMWSPDQFAIADDGHYLWIGASRSILQWDKATGDSYRYDIHAGLNHRRVLAVAIDPMGNRWFGGDAGLSRLAADGAWTHYDTANSDLPHDFVDGIAVTVDGSLWLSHGLPDGRVTHWQPDGTTHWYPNRESAVGQAYAQIRETLNVNDLWTVTPDEVWISYSAYDGAIWRDRTPPDAQAIPTAVRVDSGGGVWALESEQFYGAPEDTVFAWDGSQWETYDGDNAPCGMTENFATTLAIGPDDTVWLGWTGRSSPYENYTAYIGSLTGDPTGCEFPFDVPAPVVDLLGTPDTVWGVGPGWLYSPEQGLHRADDVPFYEDVRYVVLTTDKTLFVNSLYIEPYSSGAIQTMDDRGTIVLDDDAWQFSAAFGVMRLAEPLPDGGLWITGYQIFRGYSDLGPLRYHQGDWLNVELPFSDTASYVTDIFVESEQYTWFGYNAWELGQRGVMRLDDGGTPTDIADDTWTDHIVPLFPLTLAVDAQGRLWVGGYEGLSRYDGVAWESIRSQIAVCDIVAAADDTLFVQHDGVSYDCNWPLNSRFNNILVIRPDGIQEIKDVDALVQEEYHRVATANHRNRLWTVAPDGTIWYLRRTDDHSQLLLRSYDGLHITTYTLPFEITRDDDLVYAGDPLEVDENNHVWFAGDHGLWRLSPIPDFHIDPQLWLVAPGGSRHSTISVRSVGGYALPVTLQLSGLPSGVTATFQTNPVPAGEATLIALTADASLPPGSYNVTFIATSGQLTHTIPVSLLVAPAVYDIYGPLAAVR